jgi:hypothetical protein
LIARLLAAAALLAVISFNVQAAAGTRVALVIGNAAYEHAGRLNNAVNDARGVAEVLGRIGFEVTAVEDQTLAGLQAALKTFSRQARQAEVALVYYSGHGMEIGGTNFLVPVDARLESDVDVEFETVPMDSLLRVVEGASQLGVIILDACRNNPLAAQMQVASGTRSIGRGLARVEPVGQTLVAYAAKAGTVAEDGSGEHSPYTSALLKHLEQPGLEVRFLFAAVRDDVLAATGNAQEPFIYGSLGAQQHYFVAPPAAEAEVAEEPAPAPAASDAALDKEALFWRSVEGSKDPAAFQAYLDAFPDGTFAGLARLRIAALTGPAAQDVQLASGTTDGAQPAVRTVAAEDSPPTDKIAADAQLAALPPETAAAEPDPAGAVEAALPPAPSAGPTAEDIVRVQRRLKTLGYAVGGADGQLGPKTRSAIRAFQERAGLAVDGEVTEALLSALMSESAPAAPKPAPSSTEAEAKAVTLPETDKSSGTDTAAADALFWQSIQTSKDPADFEDYLARYPDGAFASLAKGRLTDLQAASSATASGMASAASAAAPDPAPAEPNAAETCLNLKQWLIRTYGSSASSGGAHDGYKNYLAHSGCKARGPFQ